MAEADPHHRPFLGSAFAGHMIVAVAVLLGLYLISLRSYLLFHSLVELFTVLVGGSLFVVGWNTRKIAREDLLVFLGTAYLFISFLDLIHTLAYKGMGVVSGYGANLATQLWIGARYMEALSLLAAPLFIHRRAPARALFGLYAALTGLVLLAIFRWGVFPDCFLEPGGLTRFKKASEYFICTILLGAMALLWFQRASLHPSVWKPVLLAMAVTIAAETAFTFYVSVYGLSNLLGHFFKLASFLLIYKAILETCLQRPYAFLFRRLKEREESLVAEKERLEKAQQQIDTLRELLPICAKCKKIRDDQGYWEAIDAYLTKHADFSFSHGLCPECSRELYPELEKKGDVH